MTAENFLDLALAWLRAGPTGDGSHLVIRKDRDSVAWCAWTEFMRRIGLRTAFAERHGVLTVPTTFPWDFSVDADDLRDSVWEVDAPREDPPISPERRRELSAMLRGIMPREMRRAGPAQRRRHPTLPSGFDDAHAPPDPEAPVRASDELMRKLGGRA